MFQFWQSHFICEKILLNYSKKMQTSSQIITTYTKMPRFCRREFFPNDPGGERIHIDHRKYVNSENERFCYGFALLLCSHYVFNLSYSRNLASSMAFFKKCIIKFPDDTAIPGKTLCLISKIRKTGLLSF